MKALLLALALSLAACKKPAPPSPDAASSAPTANVVAVATGLSDAEGHALVKGACLSCHSEEMLAQQRLTAAQWTKTVTKMVGWGANLEPKDAEPLTLWLASTYGPDAGPYESKAIDASAAAAALAPEPDGPYAEGNEERGRAFYMDRCSGCHGADAHGHIGVRLVDRPWLYRAAEFASTIRRGRGKMPPMTMPETDIADILAHLRRLN